MPECKESIKTNIQIFTYPTRHKNILKDLNDTIIKAIAKFFSIKQATTITKKYIKLSNLFKINHQHLNTVNTINDSKFSITDTL